MDDDYSDQAPVFEEDTDEDWIDRLLNDAQLEDEYSGTFLHCPLLGEHDPIIEGQVYQLPTQQVLTNDVEEPSPDDGNTIDEERH